MAGLPGVAALIALVFTFQSVKATDAQLQIAEDQQVTASFNAAITNLGSSSIHVRLGGVYGLQSLMQESPREQPTVVAVLCAFIRDQSASIAAAVGPRGLKTYRVTTDIQAALTVAGTRNTANDGTTTVVDLEGAQLVNAQLHSLHLGGADLGGADLAGADLAGTDLGGANLAGANLTNVADLTGQNSYSGTNLGGANLGGANLAGAEFSYADLAGADLSNADLSNADLSNADLVKADLTGAVLVFADLTKAVLQYTNLTDARLAGAELTDAVFNETILTGAVWPLNVPIPADSIGHPVPMLSAPSGS